MSWKGIFKMANFTNRATLSYTGGIVNSNTVTGTFLESLSISKTAITREYSEGSSVSYVVSIVNTGATTINGLTFTDDLGAYTYEGVTLYPLTVAEGALLYYVNGVLQPTYEATFNPTLTVNNITVPAGGNVTLVYDATVNETAPLEAQSSITNTATLRGIAEPISDSEVITVINEPVLSVRKELSPTVVPENGEITYTITVINQGNTAAVATDNLVITDVFDPVLDITSVTLNGTALTEGVDYTYNPVTGEFATTQSLVTVPAAQYTRNPDGTYTITPSEAVLVINGTI